MLIKQNNNFFTTDITSKPTGGATTNNIYHSRPQTGNHTAGHGVRLHTANGTNRMKMTFYQGFQALQMPQETLA
jgi:hypothetical protein